MGQSMPTMPMQSRPMQQMPALSCTTSTSTALMTPPQHMSPQISPRAQVQSMSYVPVPPAQQMSFVQPVMQQPMMQQPMMQPTSSITAPTTNFMPVAQPPQQTYISIPSAETYAPPAQLMSASATPSMTTTTSTAVAPTSTQSGQP